MAKFALTAAAELSAAAQFEQCCASACEDALKSEPAKASTATPPGSADLEKGGIFWSEMASNQALVLAVYDALPAQLPANPTEQDWRRAQARAVHLVSLLKK